MWQRSMPGACDSEKKKKTTKCWKDILQEDMLDILQEEEAMLDKMEEDKEKENPQKRGDEKKHEDGPKGNYETPKKELKTSGKTRRCRHGRKAGQATRLRRVCGRHLKGAAETATEG